MLFLTCKSLLIFSMDDYFWISGFAVIILKYLLHGRLLLNNCWNNREIPGVYTTHYSVRVVFGPSRVRVGQKIPSSSRVSSTRRALITTHLHPSPYITNHFRPFSSLFIHHHPFLSITVIIHPFTSSFNHFHPSPSIFIRHHPFWSITIPSSTSPTSIIIHPFSFSSIYIHFYPHTSITVHFHPSLHCCSYSPTENTIHNVKNIPLNIWVPVRGHPYIT